MQERCCIAGASHADWRRQFGGALAATSRAVASLFARIISAPVVGYLNGFCGVTPGWLSQEALGLFERLNVFLAFKANRIIGRKKHLRVSGGPAHCVACGNVGPGATRTPLRAARNDLGCGSHPHAGARRRGLSCGETCACAVLHAAQAWQGIPVGHLRKRVMWRRGSRVLDLRRPKVVGKLP